MAISNLVIESANSADLDDILRLLSASSLPTSGVAEILSQFLVIKDGETILAAGAVERHGDDGLLRSIVVDASARGMGLGRKITEALVLSSERDLYLLTETAAAFFVKYGFEHLSREEAPAELRQSEEFRCLCPESASFMRRSVDSV